MTEKVIPYRTLERGDGTVRIKRTKEQREWLMTEALARTTQYAPVTVRQLFYLLVNSGWLYKSEREYSNLGVLVTKMRRGEVAVEMPWEHIIDAGRFTRTAQTWGSPQDIINAIARSYRRDIWRDQPRAVYIGVEKEALAAVFQSVADEYAVPVVVAKGYPSATYQNDLANVFYESEKPITFFYYGDHDPSGDGISDLFEELLYMNDNYSAGHRFVRSALTAQQITDNSYLTRPPKSGDSRTKNWGDGGEEAADVDAIPPDELRDMIRADILSVLDHDIFAATEERSEEERQRLEDLAADWQD